MPEHGAPRRGWGASLQMRGDKSSHPSAPRITKSCTQIHTRRPGSGDGKAASVTGGASQLAVGVGRASKRSASATRRVRRLPGALRRRSSWTMSAVSRLVGAERCTNTARCGGKQSRCAGRVAATSGLHVGLNYHTVTASRARR